MRLLLSILLEERKTTDGGKPKCISDLNSSRFGQNRRSPMIRAVTVPNKARNATTVIDATGGETGIK
jgi:hypothetical protein